MDEKPELPEDANKKNTVVREIISWVKVIGAAVLFAVFMNNVIIVNASVPSGSMMDTIPTESRIVANRLAYMTGEPERFDVAVFKYPPDETLLYVKRIIGLPGETIEIVEGKVYINGAEEPLGDSFIRSEPVDKMSWGPYKVPEGHYFMMGDNRGNSEDSRFWGGEELNETNYLELGREEAYGLKFVAKEKILGKGLFVYWPTIKGIE